MPAVTIKPTDAAIRNYHSTLQRLKQQQGVEHEGGLRRAFGDMLRVTARKRDWTLIEEQRVSGGRVRPDGTLRDRWQLPHGYWEAKDGRDDLEVEIRRKRERDYPFSNIIFEDTNTAILYQNERRILQADCNNRTELAGLLTQFYRHETPDFSSFEEAVDRFAGEVPQIAQGLQQRINEARVSNAAFQRAFADFMALCSEALNPNISRAAVEEMLIQHLLTERLIRRVFDQENFVRRNVIAAEVEKVIDALTGQHFNRREFLGSLDRFYLAIEKAAGTAWPTSATSRASSTRSTNASSRASACAWPTRTASSTRRRRWSSSWSPPPTSCCSASSAKAGRRGRLRHRPLHRHGQLRHASCCGAWRARTRANWSAFTASGSSPTKSC